MFLELIVPLSKYFFMLNVFRYITFRTASALVVALVLSLWLGPRVIEGLRRLKVGQQVRDDGPDTHLQKSGTPTMGGVLIIAAMVISMLLFGNLQNPFVVISIIATLQFGMIGFLDDYLKVVHKDTKGLSPSMKMMLQLAVSLSVIGGLYLIPEQSAVLTRLYFPFVADFSLDLGILYIPFAAVLLIGASNAVNLTDGLDGLAIGLVMLVGAAFGAIAYLTGHFNIASYLKIPFLEGSAELSVFAGALIGASIGFLWYNSHPAQVFMGDTGSLGLGGILGVLALMIKKELLLLIVGGVFVVEALSVIIQVSVYKWKKKRVFRMAPIHHHFELKGWAENKVIIRFWIVGLLLAIISIATLKMR